MTFLGTTQHFSRKNGALRWSILVGKQKHNVQKPSPGWSTTFPKMTKYFIEKKMRRKMKDPVIF